MSESWFSRRTVIAAAEVIEGAHRSPAELTRMLLKWDAVVNQALR